MNAVEQLERYLQESRRLLTRGILLSGLSWSVGTLLVFLAIGTWFYLNSGLNPTTSYLVRLFLVLVITSVLINKLWLPLQALNNNLSHILENHFSAFSGSLVTYTDIQLKQPENPFTELLAEKALNGAQVNSIRELLPLRFIATHVAITLATLGFLMWLLVAGTGLYSSGMKNILLGWAFGDFTSAQTIVVAPGDESLRRGANLRITSTSTGFDPENTKLYLRQIRNSRSLSTDNNSQNNQLEWQEIDMVKTALGFEFTVFSLQQNLEYYVASNGLRSPNYTVTVVDVPSITGLELTYHYPEWTARDDEKSRAGDITALPETEILVKLSTSTPLQTGQLILNDKPIAMSSTGLDTETSFIVTEEGQYYFATQVGDESVRLSEDYFISLAEDHKPTIELIQPRGDYNASSIEEVSLRARIKDDYGLESVSVDYSINGARTITVSLLDKTTGERHSDLEVSHLFMLENILVNSLSVPGPMKQEASTLLQPGDIISWYFTASDRTQTIRSDMFFIQVQPFSRRFSQSQLSGGGGGNGGGPQNEISQRQRQIVVSTWNLLREQAEAVNPTQIDINAKLLSELQNTLAEQAATLAERTRARQLADDTQIEEFVENMELAVELMQPAAANLAVVALEDAINPAQEALQHLLRAESVFNELTVSQQQAGGGGGRGGQDLAEMFELEMDLSLNQYETGDRVNSQSMQEQADDIMQQLDELARRQEQLNRNMQNQQQLTEAQRYQQEMLRRDAEELREQLSKLEQEKNQRSQQGRGQQSQQDQQVAMSELQRRMESAIRAMNDATSAMNGEGSSEDLSNAAKEAQRQLEATRSQIAAEQTASMQQSFSNMAATASDLLIDQQRMAQQLRNAMQRALADRESGEDPDSRGMTMMEEMVLAKQKQNLAEELRELQQDMQIAMVEYREEAREASEELQRATRDLTDNQVETAITDAALYIDAGYGLYIAGNENNVTNAMQRLSDQLESASAIVNSMNPADSPLSQAIKQARALLSELTQQRQQDVSTDNPASTQEQNQNSAMGGQGDRSENFTGWSGSGRRVNSPINLPKNFYQGVDQLTQQARRAISRLDLDEAELDDMYDLIRTLELTRMNRNDTLLAQEFSQLLVLIEQLEASLGDATSTKQGKSVRTATAEVIPEEYRESIADYYRRLSQ